MKIDKVIDNGSSHLTLLFAGWGMDAGIVSGITHQAGDLAIVYDYRCISDFPASILDSYSQISVIAWSFGVYAASRILAPYSHLISRRIAVNGTTRPIDDTQGIPEAIYSGTLANLNESNLLKFYRRMCGSASKFTEFIKLRPQRDLKDLIEELSCFGSYTTACPEAEFRWDFAIVGTADAIFPAQAQLLAWRKSGAKIITTDDAHLPSLQNVINRFIIDKRLVAERFAKARSSYDSQSQIQRSIARRLWSLTLQHLSEPVHDILEAGSGSGYLTSLYAPVCKNAKIELWDLVDYGQQYTEQRITFCACDAEDAIKTVHPESLDLIISASTMQWFNNPEAFINSSLMALRSGGIVALSTFSPDNLKTITDITGTGLPVPTLQDIGNMVGDKANILYMNEACLDIDFESPASMLAHLSETGVTGLHHSSPITAIRRILSDYPRMESGKCRLTYTPIYLIARKK